MQCRNVERRIQELLDDRLDPSFDSELAEHAATCADCGDLLDAHQRLFDGLPLSAVPSLPPDFSQRVVNSVTTGRRRQSLLAPAAAFLAIIATLLLVVALGPRPRTQIGPADDAHAIASASLTEPSGESGIGLTDFDSREVRLAIELLVAQLTGPEAARFYHVDPLAGTIRPLASTLNVAFDAIRRSIPRRHIRSHPQPQDEARRGVMDMRII